MTELREGWRLPLDEAALAFRLGMEGMGSERLTRFIDLLAPALVTLPPQQLAALNGVLVAILQGQTCKDFLLVADLLEYEVARFLAQGLR